MNADYAGSTIRQAYVAKGTVLKAAKMNDMVSKHPMNGVWYTKPVKASDNIRFFTKDEQKAFLEAAKKSHNDYQDTLILETGLQAGEVIGLAWDATDLENRTLTANKTMKFRYVHVTGKSLTEAVQTLESYDAEMADCVEWFV